MIVRKSKNVHFWNAHSLAYLALSGTLILQVGIFEFGSYMHIQYCAEIFDQVSLNMSKAAKPQLLQKAWMVLAAAAGCRSRPGSLRRERLTFAIASVRE